MKRIQLIFLIIKIAVWLILFSLFMWYVYSSISGDSISYVSIDNFFNSIGGSDLSNTNGCLLCKYITELFNFISTSIDNFWESLIKALWLIMVLSLGIYILIHTITYLYKKIKETMDINVKEENIGELKLGDWFSPIKENIIRLFISASLLGVLNSTNTTSLKILTNIIFVPILSIGIAISTLVTGVYQGAVCNINLTLTSNILDNVLNQTMCLIGNLNSVLLAGAAGGFSLMNYSYIGLGGGAFTWLAGFLIFIFIFTICAKLLYEILDIIFNILILIIFFPLIILAYTFEKSFNFAKNLVQNSIQILIQSTLQMVRFGFKIAFFYALLVISADAYFPGPIDSYNAIFPNLLLNNTKDSKDSTAYSISQVFKICEEETIQKNGKMDKYIFKECFMREKAKVEAIYPNSFDFMDNGFEFLLFFGFIYFLYFYIIEDKINKIINIKQNDFTKFGSFVSDATKLPNKAMNLIAKISKGLNK